MASTTSAKLKLELLTNTEKAGTWGESVNVNWQLVEQAISGMATITVSNANVTLTDTDYAAGAGGSESRCRIIKIVGTLTANINIIVPTRAKDWIFQNTTQTNYSITVKTASGTGIVIPPLTSYHLYCDGTDVLMALPLGVPFSSGSQLFTSSGTFTVPAGITVVRVTVVSGGGSGAASINFLKSLFGGGHP